MTTTTSKMRVDYCDTCGAPHEATYSHEGQYGEGAIYAVVCTQDWLTDYYTSERVAVEQHLTPYPVRKSVTPRGAANARQLRPGRRYSDR